MDITSLSPELSALYIETENVNEFQKRNCQILQTSRRSQSLSDKRVCTALCPLHAYDVTALSDVKKTTAEKSLCAKSDLPWEPLSLLGQPFSSLSATSLKSQEFLKELLGEITAQIKCETKLKTQAHCDNGMQVVTNGDFYDDNIISRSKHEVYCLTHNYKASTYSKPIVDTSLGNSLGISSVLLMSKTDKCDGIQPMGDNSPDQYKQKPNLDQLNNLQDHVAETVVFDYL